MLYFAPNGNFTTWCKMKFIGRNEVLKQLQHLKLKKAASLVTIQGRRRIGKSSLVQEFAKSSKRFFEFQGLAPRKGITSQDQLNHFADQLKIQISGLPKFSFENWTEAFAFLNKQIKKEPTVLLLDEISWMASSESDFVGKLKTAWDTLFKKNDKLILVLCGSVSSWIEENIINDTDFMGRISLSIQLDELPLNLLIEFWRSQNPLPSSYDILQMVAVTGGVPRYLEEIKTPLSAMKNIESLCFNKNGLLFKDFEKIFNDVFLKRAKIYKEIVKTLVNEKRTLVEITKALRMEKSGTLSSYLKDLTLAGFLERIQSYSFSKKNTKSFHYRIKDNYLRFYLKYIEPYHNQIEKNQFDFEKTKRMAQWEQIMGLQFESTILNNLSLMFGQLDIKSKDVIWAGPYFQSKTSKNLGSCQIDLMIHTRDQLLYICELKFKKNIGTEVINEMKRKIKILKRPRYLSIKTVLIAEGEIQRALFDKNYFNYIIEGGQLLT